MFPVFLFLFCSPDVGRIKIVGSWRRGYKISKDALTPPPLICLKNTVYLTVLDALATSKAGA